jgi:hypothetical protein
VLIKGIKSHPKTHYNQTTLTLRNNMNLLAIIMISFAVIGKAFQAVPKTGSRMMINRALSMNGAGKITSS